MWAGSLLFSFTIYFFFFLLLLLPLLLIFHTLFHLFALYCNLESQTSFVRQCQWDQSKRILCQDEAFLFFFLVRTSVTPRMYQPTYTSSGGMLKKSYS